MDIKRWIRRIRFGKNYTTYFKGLSSTEQYDLLSAVRGPDAITVDQIEEVKIAITGRIRDIVFQNSIPGIKDSMRVDSSTLCSLQLLQGRVKTVYTYHYFNHLIAAIKSSIGHPIWNGQEEKILDILRGCV